MYNIVQLHMLGRPLAHRQLLTQGTNVAVAAGYLQWITRLLCSRGHSLPPGNRQVVRDTQTEDIAVELVFAA